MKPLLVGAAAVAVVAVAVTVLVIRRGSGDEGSADAQPGRSGRDGIALGIDGLRREWKASEDPSERERAIGRAAKQGTEASVTFLAELIATEGTYAARAAAALGNIANDEAAGMLLVLATDLDQPVLVRANAAKALATSGGPEHGTALLITVGNAGDPLRVRQEAALAVGKLAPPDAAAKLGSALDAAAGDRDAEDLRIALVQALGSLRNPEARSALERHSKRTLGDRERVFVQQALRE